MIPSYSVLMSVYIREQPRYLLQSLNSIVAQTIAPDQVVLVCDGPLTGELDGVISQFEENCPALQVIRLPHNKGLGQALNTGMSYCRNEIIVRMDSDDIALPQRCEKQLCHMQQNDLDLCSATVTEFTGDRQVVGRRALPLGHKELLAFAKKRNPMNHPCVVFRKKAAQRSGGYRCMPFFEDYDLWARMILQGARLGNCGESLLYMRAGSDLYRRRSGLSYCRHIARFWREMHRIGFCGFYRSVCNIAVRCGVSLLPLWAVGMVYRRKLHAIENKCDVKKRG